MGDARTPVQVSPSLAAVHIYREYPGFLASKRQRPDQPGLSTWAIYSATVKQPPQPPINLPLLRINQQKNAAAARSYFMSKAEYYLGGSQELPGTWGGKAAGMLGLDGDVFKLAFDALAENRNPATGSKLTARNRAGRTVGYDFNFYVPKSLAALRLGWR